jgi:hypothetical protein
MLTMKHIPASRKRAAALCAFAALDPMVEGSLCRADRGGQPRWQLTDRPAGKTRTLYVPAGRAEEVRAWTANWKRAKELLKVLSDLSREDLRGGAGRAAGAPRPRRTADRSRPS